MFVKKHLKHILLTCVIAIVIGLFILLIPIVNIYNETEHMRPFFKPLGPAPEYAWRAMHTNETFEPVANYMLRNPFTLTRHRNKIYILPLGEFNTQQKEIITETVLFVEAFYGMKAVQLPQQPMPQVPDSMKRDIGIIQYHAGYFLNNYLSIQQYNDAAVLIALTNEDLYPSPSWNYVFGIASFNKRVGIWSMRRLGNPEEDSTTYRMCLDRTRKIATHELGHMFCLKHCPRYPCVMNGSNGLLETDETPLWMCPDCVAKYAWNLNTSPKKHLQRMQLYWTNRHNEEYIHNYSKWLNLL